MDRVLVVSALLVTLASAQTSNTTGKTFQSYSLVDVFPLSVGNTWVYSYYWNHENYNGSPNFRYCDSGEVTVQVMGFTPGVDSMVWSLRETKCLYTIYNYSTSLSPSTSIDTFEIVEVLQGRHRLYRTDDDFSIYHSVFPLSRNFPDTAMFYRFGTVNSDSILINNTREWPGFYRFTLKQGVGQIAFSGIDGCTCMEWYGIHHSLRNFVVTGIKNRYDDRPVRTFTLAQNYPNPFNPSTTIQYSITRKSRVVLAVYNSLGQMVMKLVDDEKQAGKYRVILDATHLAGGVYFYSLQTGDSNHTKKFIVLK